MEGRGLEADCRRFLRRNEVWTLLSLLGFLSSIYLSLDCLSPALTSPGLGRDWPTGPWCELECLFK